MEMRNIAGAKHLVGQLSTITTFVIQPDNRAEFIELALRHCEQSLKDEPLTLQIEVLVPPESERTVLLLGIYLDKAAFAEHLKGSSIKELFRGTRAMVVSATTLQYVIAR